MSKAWARSSRAAEQYDLFSKEQVIECVSAMCVYAIKSELTLQC